MIYGLYLSAQGAQIQTLRQGVVANNLANTATHSFKRDYLRVKAHLPYDADKGAPTWLQGSLHKMPGGVEPYETVTDHSQGGFAQTDKLLDVGIEGPGFLRVKNGQQELLTRDGKLELNLQNQLVTRDHGYLVLSRNGLPMPPLDPSLPVKIGSDGMVSQGGEPIGQIGLFEPESYTSLRKVGKNMYSFSGKTHAAKPETIFKPGSLEISGVNPVTGMIELIESARVLEGNVNMIRAQDESLGRLLQTLSRR